MWGWDLGEEEGVEPVSRVSVWWGQGQGILVGRGLNSAAALDNRSVWDRHCCRVQGAGPETPHLATL